MYNISNVEALKNDLIKIIGTKQNWFFCLCYIILTIYVLMIKYSRLKSSLSLSIVQRC